MISLIFLPFLLQTILMTADEYFFHIKRGLPRWERLGHPIDTLSVLAIYIFVLCIPYSAYHLKWFISLSIFSSFLITKDEFIHKHHCGGGEHWVHAVLFVNHPILLTSLGLCWPLFHGQTTANWIPAHLIPTQILSYFLPIQITMITIFFLYQIIYWNFICKTSLVK